MAGVNDYRFPNLEGSVVWVRDRMEVTRATADFSGGKADFKYLMAPLGKRDQPARAVFDVNYRDVDLDGADRFLRDARPAPGRPRRGPQRDVVAARPLRRAARLGHGDVHVGRRGLQGPQLAAGRRRGGARSLPDRRARSASTRR